MYPWHAYCIIFDEEISMRSFFLMEDSNTNATEATPTMDPNALDELLQNAPNFDSDGFAEAMLIIPTVADTPQDPAAQKE